MATRPTIFKWRQTEPALILCAVRWYLRYSLSLRDIEELLEERGLEADHTTVWRWVQRYGPELEQRLRRHLKPQQARCDESRSMSSSAALLLRYASHRSLSTKPNTSCTVDAPTSIRFESVLGFIRNAVRLRPESSILTAEIGCQRQLRVTHAKAMWRHAAKPSQVMTATIVYQGFRRKRTWSAEIATRQA